MGTTEPASPRDIAQAVAELTRVTRSVNARLRRRTWWFAAIVAAVLVAGSTVSAVLLTQTARLHRIVDQDCGAFRSAGQIPLPPSAAPVAHQFVDSFRAAYDGRCTQFGELDPPVTLTPTPTSTTGR